MLVKHPKYRKLLSKNQLGLLVVICKFRFVTVSLLSEWRNKDASTIYERLLVLTEQGYLRKAYDKSYRLKGKPAVYSLTAKGIRAVRDSDASFSELVYRNQYKNSSASEQLVDHSLAIAKLCVKLERQYDSTLELFSKAEITRFDVFLRPLSDVYIRRNTIQKADPLTHYLLETVEAGTLTWILRKRLRAHQEWYEENEGDDWAFTENYPTLLFVCENTNTEKRIQRMALNSYLDFEVMTTTQERVQSGNVATWLHEWDDDDMMEFVEL